jgi:hypothetical protein
MADVAVGIRLTMYILVRLTNEGGRRDNSSVTRGSRVFVVIVEPIVIADSQCKVTD